MGLMDSNDNEPGGGAIINAGSMASTITSYSMSMVGARSAGLQFVAASGTHVGTVAVQGSNDGTNWNAITLSSTPTAANGAAFNAHVNLSDLSIDMLRTVYTATSGTGFLYCFATARE